MTCEVLQSIDRVICNLGQQTNPSRGINLWQYIPWIITIYLSLMPIYTTGVDTDMVPSPCSMKG